MKFQVLNNEPINFYNANGDLVGTIEISGSGDMIIRPESGSTKDIIIGNPDTVGDVEIGIPSSPVNLTLKGGGTIGGNSNILNIGTTGDTVNIYNAVYSQSLEVTGSVDVSGSLSADQIIGSAYSLTDLSVDGTTRTLYATASIVYSGSNITQVTQSFEGGTQQITNITYSGSFADGNPETIVVSGSDGINKIYTLTYSGSDITQILVT